MASASIFDARVHAFYEAGLSIDDIATWARTKRPRASTRFHINAALDRAVRRQTQIDRVRPPRVVVASRQAVPLQPAGAPSQPS